MTVIQEAMNFERLSMKNMSTSDRVKASREAKRIVLSINKIYKENLDPKLMDLMKRVTEKKRKIEKRLKGATL